jgi:hypothetical protein
LLSGDAQDELGEPLFDDHDSDPFLSDRYTWKADSL